MDEPKVKKDNSGYMHNLGDIIANNSSRKNNNTENFRQRKKMTKKNQRTNSLVAMLRQNFELNSDQKLSSVEINELKQEKGDEIIEEIEKNRISSI